MNGHWSYSTAVQQGFDHRRLKMYMGKQLQIDKNASVFYLVQWYAMPNYLDGIRNEKTMVMVNCAKVI